MRESFLSGLSSQARRTVVATFAVAATWALVGGLVGPIMPIYIASLGGRATDVGLASAFHAIAMGIVEPIWGRLSDRFGPRLLLGLSQFLSALVFAGFLVSNQLGWVFALQFGRGLTGVANAPIGRSILGTLLPPGQRGTAMGMWYTLSSFGRGGAGLFGGNVVDHFGYPVLFILAALLCSTAMILALAFLPSRLAQRQSTAIAVAGATPQREFHLDRFLIICLVTALALLTHSGGQVLLPLYLAQRLGLSVTEVGYLFTIQGLAIAAFTLPGGRLADRFGRKLLLLAGLALGMLAPLAIGLNLVSGFLSAAVLLAVGAAGTACLSPARSALLADAIPAHRAGFLTGIYGTAEDVGVLFGPLLGGILWDLAGPSVAFLALAAFALISVLCAVVWIREQPEVAHLPRSLMSHY
ncbi:MAG: MFS transporter [Chloroflexi bacterium]|nr:MFS transporter [Chloroflexota bacterium]